MYLKYLLIFLFVYNIHCFTAKDLKQEFYDLSQAAELFDDFVKNFNKEYKDEKEYETRFEIFKKNLEKTNDLNKKNDAAIFGITQFLDLTEEEFLEKYTGLIVSPDEAIEFNDTDVYREGAPESFDWRNQNVVTEVKNQDSCGSCWAFAAVGCIEGQYALKYKRLVSLSAQQLLDCSQAGNCKMGYMDRAMQGAARNGGLMTEQDYPYADIQTPCRFQPNRAVARVSGGQKINIQSEVELQQFLLNYGPISVGIYVTDRFQSYTGMPVSPQAMGCIPYQTTNHAVLVVGYENVNGVSYWILKNSYGTTWGDQGYMRLQAGNNPCSILDSIVMAKVV